jgi:hypothetical protein
MLKSWKGRIPAGKGLLLDPELGVGWSDFRVPASMLKYCGKNEPRFDPKDRGIIWSRFFESTIWSQGGRRYTEILKKWYKEFWAGKLLIWSTMLSGERNYHQERRQKVETLVKNRNQVLKSLDFRISIITNYGEAASMLEFLANNVANFCTEKSPNSHERCSRVWCDFQEDAYKLDICRIKLLHSNSEKAVGLWREIIWEYGCDFWEAASTTKFW